MSVPLRWITVLGLWIAGSVLFVVVAIFLTVKYYRIAHKADPSYALQLEEEIADLKQSYEQLKTAAPSAPSSGTSVPTQPEVAEPTEQEALKVVEGTASENRGSLPLLFKTLPSPSEGLAPEETASVKLTDFQVRWKQKKLSVRFLLRYNGQETRGQQGRIILIARGGETLFAHPKGVMDAVKLNESLFNATKGEYFSVKRLRIVSADFGPTDYANQLTHLDILIFGEKNDLMIHKRITLEAPAAAAPKQAPAPIPKAPPKPVTEEGTAEATATSTDSTATPTPTPTSGETSTPPPAEEVSE